MPVTAVGEDDEATSMLEATGCAVIESDAVGSCVIGAFLSVLYVCGAVARGSGATDAELAVFASGPPVDASGGGLAALWPASVAVFAGTLAALGALAAL